MLSLAGYVLFLVQGYGEDLYQWSKTLAPYSVRQYLDMSKRFALQYGHLAFLLIILFSLRYLITGTSTPKPIGRLIHWLRPHSLPIFLFHVPYLYFFAALWDHDPSDPMQVAALASAAISASVFSGILCVRIKGLFDRIEMRLGSALNGVVGEQEKEAALHPMVLNRSYSDFVHVLQILAMFTVFVGHLTYDEFSAFEPPGISAWRRWAVPFFFLISGYMAMMSFYRQPARLGDLLSNRLTGLWYMVIPLLLITPVLDHVGYALTPSVYMGNEKFIDPVMGVGGPASLPEFLLTFANSTLYLNELFIYKLLEFGTPIGGVRAFSNDAFWFLCYLVPYLLMLMIGLRMRSGPLKYGLLFLIIVAVGPPVMLLAPLFFGGCWVYLLHSQFAGPEKGRSE